LLRTPALLRGAKLDERKLGSDEEAVEADERQYGEDAEHAAIVHARVNMSCGGLSV
jgi:hypothetical protein